MKNQFIFTITTLVTGFLFLGIFFYVVYPEIPESLYTETICVPVNGSIQSTNCCEINCYESCAMSTPQLPLCSALSLEQQLRPVGNFSFTEGECNGGFKCCNYGCLLCCDGIKECRACSCVCIHSTPANGCYMDCGVCYSALVGFQYKTRDGQLLKVEQHRDFGRTLPDLAAKSQPCYYNNNDPTKVIFDKSFQLVTTLELVFIGILPLYLNFVVISYHYWSLLVVWLVWVGVIPFVVLMFVWGVFGIQECLWASISLVLLCITGTAFLLLVKPAPKPIPATSESEPEGENGGELAVARDVSSLA